MDSETATHVHAMAEKIEAIAKRIEREMWNLAYASNVTWQAELLNETNVQEKFATLPFFCQEIETILRDMTPRMLELFQQEQSMKEGVHLWEISLEEADTDTPASFIGRLNADSMAQALEKASKVYHHSEHDLVAKEIEECEGCGSYRYVSQWAVLPTNVNLRDGTSREILFCDVACPDFWDDTEPGEWVPLAGGEEVQLALWRCVGCDGVYEYEIVKMLVDTDYDPTRKFPVCSFCEKKDKERFREE